MPTCGGRDVPYSGTSLHFGSLFVEFTGYWMIVPMLSNVQALLSRPATIRAAERRRGHVGIPDFSTSTQVFGFQSELPFSESIPVGLLPRDLDCSSNVARQGARYSTALS